VGPGDATGITPSSRECWGGMPVGSYVGIPLLQGERLVGTVELGAVSPGTFTDRHLAILLTLSGQMAAALENAQLYSEIKRNLVETLRSLSAVLDARDEYTRNHSARVTKVALRVAREMKLSEETLNNLRLAGPLHDIGKIGVPDEILKSASKLTPEQRKIMEAHPAIGARILEHLKFLRGITDIVLQHQERYDGSGYPAGLTGEAIRIEARILAVADTYDAMMSRRRYRNAVFSHDDIVAEMRKYQGIQFDPGIVEAFARIPETDLQVIYESDAEALREEIPSALLDLH
ncbi:MAG: HD domain-containing phosphohydrolase, partial [Candidatus Methylomirabilales bacterium]